MSDIPEGTPVRVLAGPRKGHVGKVEDHVFGVVLVSVDGGEYVFHPDSLEPLYAEHEIANLQQRDNASSSELVDMVKPFGITSEELAEYTELFIKEGVGRIKGTGNDQYSDPSGYQKFETYELDDLLVMIQEEILDIPNYAAMLFMRIQRIRNALTWERAPKKSTRLGTSPQTISRRKADGRVRR